MCTNVPNRSACGEWAYVACIALLLSSSVCMPGETPAAVTQESVLAELAKKAVQNEQCSSCIKMDYTINFARDYSEETAGATESAEARYIGNLKVGGRPFTELRATWAQDGVRQHLSRDYFTQQEYRKGDLFVLDGEVLKWGKKPDLMQGTIDHTYAYDWSSHAMTYLGMRPFEGGEGLSALLAAKTSVLHEGTVTMGGRLCYLVDVQRIGEPVYYARMWIDAERGLPVQIHHFDKPPGSSGAMLMTKIESIRHRQLPNGGWIPVAGTRSVLYQGLPPRVKSQRVSIDVNSVTIDRKDIPESLFKLRFPSGARVYNAIVGVMTGPDFGFEELAAASLDERIETSSARDAVERTRNNVNSTRAGSESEYAESNEPEKAGMGEGVFVPPGQGPTDLGPRSRAIWVLVSATAAGFALTCVVAVRARTRAGRGGNV
jgi:hypothetical protein